MSPIIKVIKNLQNLRCLVPLSEKDIDDAEKVLGLKFADEYRTYTKKFGAISADGLELTGVVAAPRLNVVEVTISEKSLNQNIPDDMYVIENTGIDGILILQNARGEIFSISPSSKPIKKFASLTEYLQSIKN